MRTKKYLMLFIVILTAYTMKAQKGSYMELSPNLNLIDSYQSKIDGIEFSIAIDTYKKKLFVRTRDPKFKLNGKSVIGRALSSFENKADIKLRRGWGYYLKLDEYWYAAFPWVEKRIGIGKDSKVLYEISDDSKVVSVFQYKIEE